MLSVWDTEQTDQATCFLTLETNNGKLKFKCNTTYINTAQKIPSTSKYDVNTKTMLKEIKKGEKKIKGYSVLMVSETQRCHNAPVLSNYFYKSDTFSIKIPAIICDYWQLNIKLIHKV